MREWNTGRRKIHIPDMENLNKLKCRVCGKEFIPLNKNRYTAKETVKKEGLRQLFRENQKALKHMTALIARSADAR